MTEREMKVIRALIADREEIAQKRLKNNVCYQEICQLQEETSRMVEELYHDRFTKEERIAVRRHYESEIEKTVMEMNEIYLQGIKDCFNAIRFLGLLSD